MCVAMPARVCTVSGNSSQVELNGLRRNVLLTVPDVQPGDWVLVYAGAAVTKMTAAEAEETSRLLGILQRAAEAKDS